MNNDLRSPENLEIATLLLLYEPLYTPRQVDATVLGNRRDWEHGEDLLQHDYGVVDVHELSGLNALYHGLERYISYNPKLCRSKEIDLDQLPMPLAHDQLEVCPCDQVLLGYNRFRCPAELQSRQEDCRSPALCPVFLKEQLFVLGPLRDVGEDAQQEAA